MYSKKSFEWNERLLIFFGLQVLKLINKDDTTTDKQTYNSQADRQTDRQTDRQADKQAEREGTEVNRRRNINSHIPNVKYLFMSFA